jgi:hypothetical protein
MSSAISTGYPINRAGSPAATFQGMMRYNVTTIVRGLGGEVPDADGA